MGGEILINLQGHRQELTVCRRNHWTIHDVLALWGRTPSDVRMYHNSHQVQSCLDSLSIILGPANH